MRPPVIEIESTIADFVRTFRDGLPLSEFVEIPTGVLNADFFFPNDRVVVELKSLDKDAMDAETFSRRVMSAYKALGYELPDFVRWAFGQVPMANNVSRRVYASSTRPIIECVKKACKQIAATRRILGMNDAQGLVMVANSANLGLTAHQIMDSVLRGYELKADKKLDAAVYLTPNVYHDMGDNVPYELWVPIAGDHLQQFVDDLGSAWFDFRVANHGEAIRKTDEVMENVLAAAVIKDW
ncbi:hypothetical protein [Devosia sp. CAU 1758]